MYTTLAAVSTKMPLAHVREALAQTGTESNEALDTLFEQLVQTVSNEIDALLGARFHTPFLEPPAKVTHAALIFALESLYEGRMVNAEKNPWSKKAREIREELAEIGNGKKPLTPALDTAATSASPGSAETSGNPCHSERLAF